MVGGRRPSGGAAHSRALPRWTLLLLLPATAPTNRSSGALVALGRRLKGTLGVGRCAGLARGPLLRPRLT
eukprot:4636381-Alexandrium_andersonii.AAC.1